LPGTGGRLEPRGVELIDLIHRARPRLPIIGITSASDAERLIVESFRGGATDFLRKPFSIDDLRAAVTRAVPRARRSRAATRPAIGGVARVIDFLAAHVGQRVTLDELARIAGISRSHLSRTFHEAVGVTLVTHVHNLRLDKAQQVLLANPGISLTAVANRTAM